VSLGIHLSRCLSVSAALVLAIAGACRIEMQQLSTAISSAMNEDQYNMN